MDAVKILGSLLSNNALGSSKGVSILDSLLGGATGSKGGNAGDILEVLLGGQKRSSGGGMGALGAILAAAAASQGKGSNGGGGALDILGSLLGNAASSGKLGGLGSLLGNAAPAQRQSGGAGMLGDLVGSFLGGEKKPAEGGGLGGLVGSLLGGSGGSGGGLSSLLGAAGSQAGGGELLGLLVGGGEPATPPQEAQEEAAILIEAMCNAAKCDGTVDEAERSAILGKMGSLDEDEVAYLRDQLASPLDLEGFLAKVTDDMDEQVYAFSLMAVRLDTQKEAEYFGQLAQGLGLDGETANAIHERLGQPEIFA
jgi:hypothetical protein